MKIVVYDTISDEIACVINFEYDEIVTYGSFNIRYYGDNIEPMCEINPHTMEAFIDHSTFMLVPDSYYEEIEGEDDEDKTD